MTRRLLVYALALALVIVPVTWPGPGRAQEPSKRLEKLRAEIEAREARARELTRQAEGLFAQLEGLDMEINEARRNQTVLSQREREVKTELDAARTGLEESKQQTRQIEGRLAPRLVALYKFSVTGGIPALYSARDFQESLRLRDGLSRVLAADAQLFAQYRNAQRDSERRAEQAEALSREVTATRQMIGSRRKLEDERVIERRNLAALAKQRASREEQAANELREAARRLESELANLPASGAARRGELVKGALLRPVKGKIRTGFGILTDPEFKTRIRSTGIEFDAPFGTGVAAVAGGRVVYAGWFRGYGQVVILDHGDDSLTVSGYLDELAVGADERVSKGQIIGKVGETGSLSGPGLYFELRRNGKPVDPIPWFAPGTEGKS